MKTAITIMVAAIAAFMGGILIGGNPIEHPFAYAASTGVLWAVFDSIGGVPGVEVRRKG